MSEWQFVLSRQAKRYLERLPLKAQNRIIVALESLVPKPEGTDIKPLKGRPESRLRVGDYRVILRVDQANKIFIVTRIGPRGDVYK